MAELRDFQKNSATAAVRALSPRTEVGGSQRHGHFLLADEVGLGKTHVAKAVIDKLSKGKQRKEGRQPSRRKRPVLYFCPSHSIAIQNLEVLDPDRRKEEEKERRNRRKYRDRITLFPVAWDHKTPSDVPECLVFPVRRNLERQTSNVHERALLCLLLSYRSRVKEKQRLQKICEGQASKSFDNAMKKIKELVHFGLPAVKDLVKEVKSLPEAVNGDERKWLKGCLEKLGSVIVKKFIKPSLVVFDEFQKYPFILNEEPVHSVVEVLTSRENGCPVLLMSATPFKENTSAASRIRISRRAGTQPAGDGFERLIRFLSEGNDRAELLELSEANEAFVNDLHAAPTDKLREKIITHGKTVIAKMQKLQAKLMCRTERITLSTRKPAAPRSTSIMPSVDELREYFALCEKTRHCAKESKNESSVVLPPLELSKSGAYILSFVQGGTLGDDELDDFDDGLPSYKMLKSASELRVGCTQWNRHLYLRLSDIKAKKAIPLRNEKLTKLYEEYIQEVAHRLWISPIIKYYDGPFDGEKEPRKALVFSRWRFVPDMIACLFSKNAAVSLEVGRKKRHKGFASPIKSPETIETFFPWFFLAQIDWRKQIACSSDELVSWICKEIEQRLKRKEGIEIASSPSNLSVAELLCCLDDKFAPSWVNSFWKQFKDNESPGFQEYLTSLRVAACKKSGVTISVSKQQIREMAIICLCAPGVSLLRSCLDFGTPGKDSRRGDSDPDCFLARLQYVNFYSLRRFFSRPLAKTAVDVAWKKRRTLPVSFRKHQLRMHESAKYFDKVLCYCHAFHLQSVFDEFLHLAVRQAGSTIKALDLLHDTLGNIQTRKGVRTVQPMKQKPKMPKHIVSAFHGQTETNEDEEAIDLRSCFNSPFWPFMLVSTSVGQEGLDFHWYCRDIVHWNLPRSPIDLEQREGRLDRFKSFAVRQCMGQRFGAAAQTQDGPAWQAMFDNAEKDHEEEVKRSRGLVPFWISAKSPAVLGEGDDCSKENPPKDSGEIRSRMFEYVASGDVEKRASLYRRLDIYRAFMGHPRRADYAESLAQRDEETRNIVRDHQESLWLNLTPEPS